MPSPFVLFFKLQCYYITFLNWYIPRVCVCVCVCVCVYSFKYMNYCFKYRCWTPMSWRNSLCRRVVFPEVEVVSNIVNFTFMPGLFHLLNGSDLLRSHGPEFLHVLYSVASTECTELTHLQPMNGTLISAIELLSYSECNAFIYVLIQYTYIRCWLLCAKFCAEVETKKISKVYSFTSLWELWWPNRHWK